MSLAAKYFKKISPDILLKWGCPPLEFIKMNWKRMIPDPVCNWGIPIRFQDGVLTLSVSEREYIPGLRAGEAAILRALNRYPSFQVSSLELRLMQGD